MRNALGLMLASVVAAVVIAAFWFWTSSPRADIAAPKTVSAAQPERLAAAPAAKPIAPREDVEVTAAIPARLAVPPQPKAAACANPDALGVTRVVEIDTTGGPGFGFEHFKQLDFLADKEVAQIVNTVMTKLDKQGKGIILMHDFQKHTAEALPTLLRRLKAGGYKVVQMRAKAPLQTLAEYDEALVKDMKVPVATTRPVGSVVQTVSE